MNMIYLVEHNFTRGDDHTSYIDSAWSSYELAEARIIEFRKELEWFMGGKWKGFKSLTNKQQRIVRKLRDMIDWKHDLTVVLEFKIDENFEIKKGKTV